LLFNVDEDFAIAGKAFLELDIADPVTDRACHRISSKWSFPGAYLRHLRKFRLAVDVLPY
jgi:hypothetical protein